MTCVEEVEQTASHARTINSEAANLLRLLAGKHITYSLSAVAKLGVADHINAKPVSTAELAAKVADKSFSHTAISELLKTDAPGSLRYLATFWGDPWSTRAFENMAHILCTGEDGVTKAYGKNVFEVLADEPAQAETFHRGIVNVSALVGGAISEAYDFSGFTRIADIGGGHGMLLASILRKYPHLEGVLYDLPEVVAGAPQAQCLSDIKSRVQIEAGSFFQRIPGGCDATSSKIFFMTGATGTVALF